MPDPISILIVTSVILVSMGVVTSATRARRNDSISRASAKWTEAADQLGLSAHGRSMMGEVDGRSLVAEATRTNTGGVRSDQTVVQVTGLTGGLRLHPRRGRGDALSDSSLPTHDDAFDGRYEVFGPQVALGLLGPSTRAELVWAAQMEWDVRLRDGQLTVTRDGRADAKMLVGLVHQVRILAQHLSSDRQGLWAGLAARVATEHLASTRRLCLEVLLERAPRDVGDPVAVKALGDVDAAVRLRAARHLGRTDVVWALARDATLAAALRAEALGSTGAIESQPELLRFLADADRGAQAASIRALGAVGNVEAVPALHAFIDRPGTARDLHDAARDAIRTIQARLGGQRGGVAIASSSGGGLAVVDPQPVATGEGESPRPRPWPQTEMSGLGRNPGGTKP